MSKEQYDALSDAGINPDQVSLEFACRGRRNLSLKLARPLNADQSANFNAYCSNSSANTEPFTNAIPR
jgi:hypothetical protein